MLRFFASASPTTKDNTRKTTRREIAFVVNEETIWRSPAVFAANPSLGSS
jgi:hypothetical protein